jgi:hypothetical protein
MSTLKYWLVIVGMMLSMSATAGTTSTASLPGSAYSSQYNPVVSKDFSAMLVRTDEQHKKLEFAEETVRANTHRSVLFLAEGQTAPTFDVEFEFSSPDLSSGRYIVKPLKTVPWFLQTSGRTRVNGWKDGNSLYAASITYHS